MTDNEVKYISKIRIETVDYNIKDEELRKQIAQFMGTLEKETEERKGKDGLESND